MVQGRIRVTEMTRDKLRFRVSQWLWIGIVTFVFAQNIETTWIRWAAYIIAAGCVNTGIDLLIKYTFKSDHVHIVRKR